VPHLVVYKREIIKRGAMVISNKIKREKECAAKSVLKKFCLQSGLLRCYPIVFSTLLFFIKTVRNIKIYKNKLN
jgi:hypothetical protein